MAPLSPALLELLSKVLGGEASSEELLHQIQLERTEPPEMPGGLIESGIGRLPGATVDLGRNARCGFGEVIYGEGKSAELITQIIQIQLDAGQSSLVTRIDSGIAFRVRQAFPFAHHNPIARTLRIASSVVSPSQPLTPEEASRRAHAAVVTAGSTDLAVAEEAMETLTWMGVNYQRFDDIGVAGPQRLVAAIPQLRLASAVVVVAGMEGALPSVVGGHLSSPVFAVPTSVGYGASLGGLTPLMGMLSACVASVAVVNIDAGFKGGYLAGLVVSQLIKAQSSGASR
jgi:NCAIR mutase (PurE)-related protein